ncbi:hypothetical protein ABZ876_16790 [Streptomyces sp. NPDC046931]|uniref:LexA family protein n=1 Tax=Streptomyces sp. NPDC046931 TaxID=3154806 RepID=UPI0033E02107
MADAEGAPGVLVERTNLGSIGSVHHHLKQLKRKGILVREHWQPRGMRLAR